MIAFPLLLQGMMNENATLTGVKPSCDVDAEADDVEECTGLADPGPDNTEGTSAPLSGWDDDTSVYIYIYTHTYMHYTFSGYTIHCLGMQRL